MEEGALSGRKGTGLFWSKNNERERSDGGGGGGRKCTRAFSQDPPQLNFLDVVFKLMIMNCRSGSPI